MEVERRFGDDNRRQKECEMEAELTTVAPSWSVVMEVDVKVDVEVRGGGRLRWWWKVEGRRCGQVR